MTANLRIALVPRDGLFCKDGRGWHTSASGRGHGLDWPWPSTVLGALRTAWGRGEERRSGAGFSPEDWLKRTAEIRIGRTLVVRRPHGAEWRAEQRVWPVPADAVWLADRAEVQRLDPAPGNSHTLGRDDDKAREALWWPVLADAGKPLAPPRSWSDEDFCAWLAGRPVPIGDGHRLALARRVQVHVGISPEKLTSVEGVLFSHDVLETIEKNAEWAIGIEANVPGAQVPGVATLGSDSRLAQVEPLPGALFDSPQSVLEAFQQTSIGMRLVVVTPACFGRGWLPDGLDRRGTEYGGRLPGLDGDVVLRAAFVPRPLHASGWDMAAGAPKSTSRLVAPGAVYFFERLDGQPFGETDARALWLAAIGGRTDEGFGRVVPGVWKPTRSNR